MAKLEKSFPTFPGYDFTLVPRPPESALKPPPPQWLTDLVNEGRKELKKGGRYRNFMEIPGAQAWAFYNRHGRKPPMGPSDATLARIVEKKFGQGMSAVEIAKQEGEGYQTMKRWLALAEQRGFIDAHQRRVTTELGPAAIDALQAALAPHVDIRTRVKAALGVQKTLETMNAYVAKREDKIEKAQKEDTLDDIIARMRQQRARAAAKEKLVSELGGGEKDGHGESDDDAIDAEYVDHRPDPARVQRIESSGSVGDCAEVGPVAGETVTHLSRGAEESGVESGEEIMGDVGSGDGEHA